MLFFNNTNMNDKKQKILVKDLPIKQGLLKNNF